MIRRADENRHRLNRNGPPPLVGEVYRVHHRQLSPARGYTRDGDLVTLASTHHGVWRFAVVDEEDFGAQVVLRYLGQEDK